MLLPLFCAADITDWYKVRTDNSGNIYVLGHYNGSVVVDNIILGDSNNFKGIDSSAYFLAKYDSTGGLLWVDSIVGITTNCFGLCPGFVGLVIDNDNNVLISLSGHKKTVYRGVVYAQPNIIKLDSTGNVLWTKRIYKDGFGETDISVDGYDNVYFASVFVKSVISDSDTLYSCDSSRIKTCVVKLGKNGATKWIREIASPLAISPTGIQECFFLQVDSVGNSYVGGMASGTISLGNFNFTSSGFYPFIAKLDSNGSSVFLKGYPVHWIPGTSHSNFISGNISHNQKLYVCGKFRDTVFVSSGKYVVTKSNVATPYIAETSTANGDAVWYQYNRDTSSFAHWNIAYSICSDENDNSLVIGDVNSAIKFLDNATVSTLTPGLSNTYFAKFDSLGNFQCYKTDTSMLLDGTTYGSNYYTVGISNENTIGQIHRSSITLVKWDINYCAEIWRRQMNQVVVLPIPISVESVSQKNKFRLYPNPSTNGIFNLEGEFIEIVDIHVYDIYGKRVAVDGKNGNIDISVQPKGVYILKVTSKDRSVFTGKLLYR